MRAGAAWRSYLLSVVATAAAVVTTRVTWPFFAAAPFVPTFGTVAAVSQWGGGGAGLLAAVLSAAGLVAAFQSAPSQPPFGWRAPSLLLFAVIAIVGNRLIVGRKRAIAALRASDAELRATLTQMRASEEQLRRAQKMKAVGQLAAGISHNFNNLLQVTMGYLDVLGDVPTDGPIDREALAEIKKATERGAALTRQLMTFSLQNEPRVSRIDLDQAVDSLRGMLSRVVREDIELELSLGAEAGGALIDPADFEQVMINLVINARDAMPSGGAIRIDSARVTVAAADVPAGQHAVPGRYTRVRIIDNGSGMAPEVQAHLFEPFFTTKEIGQGTGLGLAFVHGVAQHAGGFISVQTAPGRGTTVSIFLPLAAEGPPESEPPPEKAPPVLAGRATILLVDDETGMRATTSRTLTRAGYHVLGAASAAEAMMLFEANASSIDLLVTDVVMPGLHGPALAARLAAIRPDLRVVFVSGYSHDLPALPARPRGAFLAKPFTAASLLRTIDRLLAADPD
ncbi:MAG TPA: ATP-binding protein [Vicinamibacterales bacterium]|jgi:signal transduction histidine kinase